MGFSKPLQFTPKLYYSRIDLSVVDQHQEFATAICTAGCAKWTITLAVTTRYCEFN